MSKDPFPIRGVIEGFYGVYYTFPERNDLIRFIGKHGFNLYIYAPKNDRQHRNRWWEPYPKKIIDQFLKTIEIARQSGVEFCYALSPGVSMSYASPEDYERIQAKLTVFYDLGVRSFSLLLDDISPEFVNAADSLRYHSRPAAQADLCNRINSWLKGLDPSCKLSICPTEYYGTAPFDPALLELGACLNADIDIFYTGPEICSQSISAMDAHNFAETISRKPLIWDNYPVNDLKMEPELHIGPITGRDPYLDREVRGIVVNLMIQAEASKIPLATYGDFMANPARYQPVRSWESALLEIAGDDSFLALHRFAENSLGSCLGVPATAELGQLVESALASLRSGVPAAASLAFNDLKMYLAGLDEACYHLLNRMDNLALRQNLIPWIVSLDHWQRAGQDALEIIEACESGLGCEETQHHLQEYLEMIHTDNRRIGGEALQAIIDYALSLSKIPLVVS
jgi:hyaluronoglucosaminidase